ncbi:YrhK family protein [Microbaculum marinisediminis]|uniref:YrhK family protein n=1 Tax=Microbaculum marinisediminis TaxID=2931392 RepID=A0AAW5QUZ6_9HYPH|nr:YrhK family protein [Microbaculum sp. A6E488]MCT8970478.1 YrhK family protein [Microbaculum sp. A6E488]
MPHLIANRPRLYDLTRAHPSARDQFRWETINAVTYKLGGVVFIVGSVMFFPQLEAWADVGAWLFVVGSLMYLAVNLHDVAEVVRHRRETRHTPQRTGLNWTVAKLTLEALAVGAYVLGSLLFIVGSVLFLSAIDWVVGGAWCFIVGSLLFVVGASVNILQIVEAESLVTMQLMNLTAVTYVIGSVLFAVASVPYLWRFAASADETRTLTFLAAQFVIGSALFLLGGLFNYRRAFLVIRRKLRA